MSTAHFYAGLGATEDFAAFADPAAYAPLPDDWTLLASDVVASTNAIEAGRYKQVNMAGAATIMGCLNAVGELAVPYMFGGDGAVIAVPAEATSAATDALARAAGRTQEAYGLDLRVAAFPVAALRAEGADIGVLKLALGPTARLALFNGDGVAHADRLLKEDEAGSRYHIPASDAPPDLEGLSCRWEPLNAANGVMLAIMAAAVGDEPRALAEARRDIHAVLGGEETAAAPVSNRTLRFRWPPRGLRDEATARFGRARAWRGLPRLVFESLAQAWAERFGKRAGPYDAPVYRQELLAQTDFRRFDGQLRMLLDVTPAQADAIAAALEARRATGRIVYGLHRADSALMTCLVFDLTQADHIHFVDGADGGFALAARQLKAQMANLRQD